MIKKKSMKQQKNDSMISQLFPFIVNIVILLAGRV